MEAAFDGGLQPKTGEAQVDGMRMAYLVWGDDTPPGVGPQNRPCKAKQDVVLIHGLTSTSRTWWRIGPALAEAGYRVVAPDLPGHGDSTPPADDYALRHTAEAVDALLVALDVRAPIVAGHSWGGAIALVYATEPGMQVPPSRVILLDPLLYFTDGSDTFVKGLSKMCGTPRAELAVTLREIYPRWHDGDVFWKAEALEKASPAAPLGLVDDNPGLNLIPQLRQIRVPWSIVAADPRHGGIVNAEIRPAVEEAIGANGGRLEDLPGAGHDIHRDDFPATLHALRLV
jgi:pimeloyl-ACP methyl ester carboxylesterase